MIKLIFDRPLTALEIREPAIEACELAAHEFDLFANFRQPQQIAFNRTAGTRFSRPQRQRIGNGRHKDWYIDFQREPQNASTPTVVGTLAIKSAFCPEAKQYGGFDYGRLDGSESRYGYVTVCTTHELNFFRAVDPKPALLARAYEAIRASFDTGQITLFELDQFVLH